jgi:hypothetical protein
MDSIVNKLTLKLRLNVHSKLLSEIDSEFGSKIDSELFLELLTKHFSVIEDEFREDLYLEINQMIEHG